MNCLPLPGTRPTGGGCAGRSTACVSVFSAWTVVLGLALAACGSGSPPSRPRAAASPSPTQVSPIPSGPAGTSGPTFLVVMENRAYAQALGGPFTASLAASQTLATDYHAVSHPSLPNYLALSSGSTWGISDDGYHPLPAGQDLGSQLTSAGIAWRAYMEGMSRGCQDSPYPYALKHNPFGYYGGRCPEQVQPLDRLEADLSSGAPLRFVWITPDLCHDGHDCSTADADAFLKTLVGRVTGSPAWRGFALLVITWDEDDGGSGNHVPLIAVTVRAAQRHLEARFDHYSLLAMIEDRLGVARLGAAAQANAIPDPTIST